MEYTLAKKADISYHEVIMKIQSILTILEKSGFKQKKQKGEVLLLQMSAIPDGDTRFKSVGSLFNYVLYLGLVSRSAGEESRIFRKSQTEDRLLSYVSYKARMRQREDAQKVPICPESDMWFVITEHPTVTMYDIVNYKMDGVVYLRTDVKPIRL